MPKTVKGGPLRFFNIHSVAKIQKKTEGRPFGVFRKMFEKKKQKLRNFNSLSAKKCEKRDPLGFSSIRSFAKQIEGRTLWLQNIKQIEGRTLLGH